MNSILLITITFILAMLIVLWMHPQLVRIAKLKNIVDNPNPRKLQRKPVPVLGGIGVITGVLITVGIVSPFINVQPLMSVFAVIFIMLFIGVADDILDLRAEHKLVYQFLAIGILMASGGYIFNDLNGLFGIYEFPYWLALILTIIGCTGMIVAVNFIDGVDGLVSGYGIMVTTISGACFWIFNDMIFAVFCFATAGALLPFFIHNVFGDTNKMFFGDGGSMALGVVFSTIIIHFLNQPQIVVNIPCPLGFITALFSIVLFDCLRVLIYRFWIRKPWESGKHHLHHFFISFGFSHIATTLTILGLNLSVLGIWYLSAMVFGIKEEFVLLIVCMYGLTTVSAPWAVYASLKRKAERKVEIKK